MQNAESIAGFYTSIYGSCSEDDFDRIRDYMKKWFEIDFCRLDREFYGPRMIPPEGPRSFLYGRLPSDHVCLGQCIEFEMDTEQPGSPRSTFDLDAQIVTILSQGRQLNWHYDHSSELPTPSEVHDNSSEAGSTDDDDMFQQVLRHYREQRHHHEEDQLARITWEEAEDYMRRIDDEERDLENFNLENADIDLNDSETETWIDDTYTIITNERGVENGNTNTRETDAGFEIGSAAESSVQGGSILDSFDRIW
ncbi:MAG: hypothetical protein Q9167_006400 [Letrouitia subvulpina]